MKYCETGIVFREFPDEVTLAINISECPHRCKGCHSPHLQEDCGEILDESTLGELIRPKKDLITCVGFMGGDADVDRLVELAQWVRKNFPRLKTGWYSGNSEFPAEDIACNFDYIKTGPYVEALGPLDSPTTNQKLYKRHLWGWDRISPLRTTKLRLEND